MKPLEDLNIADLVEEFEFLGSWEEQCEYLIDLGFEVPPMPEDEKTEQTRVHGCQSLVWLTVQPQQDAATGSTTLLIHADSDAMIVKGLIAVLLTVYNNKTPEEILRTDIAQVFTTLGLDQHLSSARKNGLAGMVQRIQVEAARYV